MEINTTMNKKPDVLKLLPFTGTKENTKQTQENVEEITEEIVETDETTENDPLKKLKKLARWKTRLHIKTVNRIKTSLY